MKILAKHESILHSRASLLIFGLSNDGTILNPTINRLMSLYPCFYHYYKEQTQRQTFGLGDIITHQVHKQSTGLSIDTHKGVRYIIGVIAQNHPTQDTRLSAWQNALGAINNKLHELMRYHGVHQIALLAPKDNNPSVQENAYTFWQCLQKLSTPRVRLDVHFDKNIDIGGFLQRADKPQA